MIPPPHHDDLGSQRPAAGPARIAQLEGELAALREEHRLLQAALDAVADMVLVKGPQSRIVYANRAFCDYYGMSAAQLRDLIDAPFNEPDYTAQYVRDDAAVFSTGQTLNIPVEPVTRHDGVVRLFHTVKSAIRDSGGTITHTVGISRDITAHDELAVARRTFEAMVEGSPDAIISVQGLTITYANAATRALFGYDDEAWAQINLVELHAPEDQPRLPEIVEGLRETGVWRGTLKYQRQGGWTFLGQASIFQLPQSSVEGGEPTHVGIIRDVTAQRAQDQALRRFEALAEHALDGVAVTDGEGLLAYMNPAFRAMTGLRETGAPLPLVALFPPERRAQLAGEMLAAVGRQGYWQGEGPARRPDGSPWIAQLSVVSIAAADGAPQLGAICRDVTAQRQADAERAALQEQIIAAQQATLRELSTPLIPLADQVMVLPLIGSVDSTRAQQMIEVLLQGVAAHRASTVLVDISGVKVVDTHVADALLRAARAVRLLGAQVVLTGISPEVAQTIVQLGADLSGVVTQATLQAGLRMALGAEGRPGPAPGRGPLRPPAGRPAR